MPNNKQQDNVKRIYRMWTRVGALLELFLPYVV